MARRYLAITLLFICLVASVFADRPKLLIVQDQAPKVKDLDPNVDLMDYVAQALDDDGRVTPIVGSNTDPVYRAALDAGKIKAGHETLTHAEAEAAARALGCEYLLVIQGKSDPGGILVKAELFRGGKRLWRDPDSGSDGINVTEDRIEELYKAGKISKDDYNSSKAERGYRKVSVIQQGKFSESGTSRSVARTWTLLLQTSAFRNLEPKKRLTAPEISQGQVPKVLQDPIRTDDTHPLDPVKAHAAENEQIFASVAAAVKANRTQDAILILREAVDASPLDVDRRKALVKALSDGGYNDMAAQEAVRSARIVPEKGAFELEGAQAAVAAGQFDLAQTEAMKILAKDPNSSAAQRILGEVLLMRGDYAGAIERLNASVDKGGGPETYGYRAFARALVGNAAGAIDDWNVSVKAAPAYALWVPVMNAAAPRLFVTMKTILPRVAAKAPQDSEAAKTLANNVRELRLTVDALAKLTGVMVPPQANQKSHGRRVLAFQLLSQSLFGIESLLQKPDEDALSDARINFGEALKQWEAALALAKSE